MIVIFLLLALLTRAQKATNCGKKVCSCIYSECTNGNFIDGQVKIIKDNGDTQVFDKIDIKNKCGQTYVHVCESLAHFTIEPKKNESPKKKSSGKLWPKQEGLVLIPFCFDHNGRHKHTSAAKTLILSAIEEVNSWVHHCVRFVEYDSREIITDLGHENSVVITTGNKNTFCSSPVGLLGTGEQKLIVGKNCLRTGSKGAVIHELMHTLGFGHEHQRADRDKHLTFKPQNVRKGNMFNFKKLSKNGNIPEWARLGTSYDRKSIMHYGSWTLAKTGPVILTKGGSTIKQAKRASSLDEYEVCLLYECGCDSGKCCPSEAFFCEKPSKTNGNMLTDEFAWKKRLCDKINDCDNKMDELICQCKCTSFYIEGLFDSKVLFQRDGDAYRWKAENGERTVEMHLEPGSKTNVFNVIDQVNRDTTQTLAWVESVEVCPENVDVFFISGKGGVPGKVICEDSVDVKLNLL